MATHDYVIDNSTGANVRADINNVLQAILTNNSSSSSPSTTAAYMFWADTTSGTLKIRNSSDNAWVELLQLDGTLTLENGSASTPALANRSDLNTGVFFSAADTFDIATGGVGRFQIDSSEITFNETGADTDFRIEGSSSSSLFFCNAGDNRIGISTSTPDSLLHVFAGSAGSISAAGSAVLTLEKNADTALQFLSPSSNNQEIRFGDESDNGSGYILYSHSSNFLSFGLNGGSEKMRIDSSGNLLLGASSYGGGGSSPAFYVSTTSDRAVKIHNTNTATCSLQLTNAFSGQGDDNGLQIAALSNGDALIQNVESGSLRFSTLSTERMRLDTSGRLLIGKDASKASDGENVAKAQIESTGNCMLDIAANGTTSSSYAALNLIRSDGSSVNDHTAVDSGDRIARINFIGADGSDRFNSCARITAFAAADFTANNCPGHLVFETNSGAAAASERMRITKDGNVLINSSTAVGGSNPQLQVVDTTDAEIYVGNTHTNATGACSITFGPSNGVTSSIIQGYAIEDGSSSAAQTGGLKFFVREDGNFKESFRLNREGNINVAESGDSNVAKLDVVHSGNNGGAGVPTYVCRFYQGSNNTGIDHANIQSRHNGALSGQNGVAIDFKNNGGSTTGTIVQGQSTVGYNTSSDYRLKENIVNITDGITRIKQLSPKRFNFIADTTNTLQDGFIAHEVTPVIPEAVTGVKDATYTTYYDNFDTIPEGKAIGDVKEEAAINPQSLDYAKFTPLITAALQEAIAKIEVLETKVAALEAA